MCDSRGAIHAGREDLNPTKLELLGYTNRGGKSGSLREVIEGAQVFIGVSVAGVLSADDVRTMADDPILFPMANPVPEIMPELALEAGAAIVGTGRSDYPNQVNNVLVFPGIFRGALDAGAERITAHMKVAAAYALADAVDEPVAERILPSAQEMEAIMPRIASAVAEAAQSEMGLA